jgi:hypothetical protein
MRELIRKILNESKIKDQLKQSIEDNGLSDTIQYVGGVDNLLKLLYDSDIIKFYEETGFTPVKITENGMNMYIDDLIIQSLGLEAKTFSRGKELEVSLGDFNWNSKGSNYKFTARARSFISQKNGQKLWRVVGTSGDYGFGYSFIPTRNILGKRARKQIFDQIIDKYNLQQYL